MDFRVTYKEMLPLQNMKCSVPNLATCSFFVKTLKGWKSFSAENIYQSNQLHQVYIENNEVIFNVVAKCNRLFSIVMKVSDYSYMTKELKNIVHKKELC